MVIIMMTLPSTQKYAGDNGLVFGADETTVGKSDITDTYNTL
jgi:hypothetical protein